MGEAKRRKLAGDYPNTNRPTAEFTVRDDTIKPCGGTALLGWIVPFGRHDQIGINEEQPKWDGYKRVGLSTWKFISLFDIDGVAAYAELYLVAPTNASQHAVNALGCTLVRDSIARAGWGSVEFSGPIMLVPAVLPDIRPSMDVVKQGIANALGLLAGVSKEMKE
jgi:hypothetical protein